MFLSISLDANFPLKEFIHGVNDLQRKIENIFLIDVINKLKCE